tara:strand:+ start:220 stop:471 length:252 start_codon:yes stop_codon:yes gene_type:complete
MKAKELIEELEWAIEQNGGDVEVRLASQPKWAFEKSLRSAITVETKDGAHPLPERDREKIVYLEEGSQIGYLPAKVSEELGWS